MKVVYSTIAINTGMIPGEGGLTQINMMGMIIEIVEKHLKKLPIWVRAMQILPPTVFKLPQCYTKTDNNKLHLMGRSV